MTRLLVVALATLAMSSCTLLMPTGDLIKPCASQADCDDGFVCDENACLPEDSEAGASG